jgi:hypothetical protein
MRRRCARGLAKQTAAVHVVQLSEGRSRRKMHVSRKSLWLIISVRLMCFIGPVYVGLILC